MKRNVIILALILVGISIHAQWRKIPSTGLPPVIKMNKVTEKDNKLYALTDSGIYESASGLGGDWLPYGNGIDTMNVIILEFTTYGTYAYGDKNLVRLNGNTWEYVYIDVDTFDIGPSFNNNLSNIWETTDGVKNYLFLGGWNNEIVGIYRFDGATWTRYADTTSNENTSIPASSGSEGLHPTWGYRTICDKMVKSSDGKIYAASKNVLQLSDDFGETWYWRIGNFMRADVSNISDIINPVIGGIEYMYMTHRRDAMPTWSLGRTKIGDSVGLAWEKLDIYNVLYMPREIILVQDAMYIRDNTSKIYVSYDYGYTVSLFMDSLIVSNNLTSLSEIKQDLYATKSNGEIWLFNLGIYATIKSTSCPGFNDGSIKISCDYGTPPYTYLWSNGNTSDSIGALSPGIYKVTVTDVLSEKKYRTYSITETPSPSVNAYSNSPVEEDDSLLIFENGGEAISWSWSGPDGFSSTLQQALIYPASLSDSGLYHVTITNSNGCTSSDSVTVKILLSPKATGYWEKLSTNGITGLLHGNSSLQHNNNKLYIVTTSGVYESGSGNGGDWVHYGNGLQTKNVSCLHFSSSITLALANDSLFKLNSGNWQYVQYDIPGDTIDLVGGNAYTQIFESNNRIFLGTWKSGGSYGLFYSDDNAVTWTHYADTATYQNQCCGLNLDFSSRVIASKWAKSTTSGKLFTSGKNVVQVSEDNGTTWYWRLGNYSLPYNQTVRDIITRNYNGKEYLFMASVDVSWDMGRSLMDDSVALKWDNLTTPLITKPRKYQNLGNDYLFILDDNKGILHSKDNGTSWKYFNNGLSDSADILNFSSSDNQLFATTDNDTLWRYIIGLYLDYDKTNISCFGNNDGRIKVYPKNGNSPYSYLWSNGKTADSISGLSPGIYTVTVTDLSLKTIIKEFSISEPSSLMINLGNDTTLCPGSTLLLDAGDYDSYAWNTSVTTRNINVSSPGLYIVTVSNTNHCSTSDSILISYFSDNLSLGGDTTVCIGKNVTLSAGNGYIDYLWSNNETSASITVSNSGTYSVKVMDANYCQFYDTLTIANFTNPVVSLQPDTSVCNGKSVTFNAGTYSSYTWSSGESTQSITKSVAGTYTVTVTDANGCQGSDAVSLTVNSLPTPNLGANQSVCSGSSKTFNAGTYSSYTWSSGESTQSITKSLAGTYTVTVTDANGCQGSDAVSLTVNSLPTPNLGANQSVCSGSSKTFNAGTYSSYTWSSGESTQSITKSVAGNYTVTVTDANGCQGSDTVSLQIITVTIDLGTDKTKCKEATIQLDAGTGYSTYLWNTGSTTQTVLADTAGTYRITISDANGCTNSDYIIITELATPDKPVIIGPSTVSPFETKNYGVTSHVGSSYYWMIEGGMVASGQATNLIAVYWGDEGAGSVKVLETGSNGCKSDTASLEVTIGTVTHTNTISSEAPIIVYPNPASNHITIEYKVESQASVDIALFSNTGKLVETLVHTEKTPDTYQLMYDVRNLPGGVYALRVMIGGGVYRLGLVVE